MKKWMYVFMITVCILVSFKIGETEGVKQYRFEQDLPSWQKSIEIIQGLQQVAGDGNAKYGDVVYLKKEGDSLVNKIILQINPQLSKDSTKAKK